MRTKQPCAGLAVIPATIFVISFLTVFPCRTARAEFISTVDYNHRFSTFSGSGNELRYPVVTGHGTDLIHGGPFANHPSEIPFEGEAGAFVSRVNTNGTVELGLAASAGTTVFNPVLTSFSQTTASATFIDRVNLQNLPPTFVVSPAGSGTIQNLVYGVLVNGNFGSSHPSVNGLHGSLSAGISAGIYHSVGAIDYTYGQIHARGFDNIDLSGTSFSDAFLKLIVPIALPTAGDFELDYSLTLNANAIARDSFYFSTYEIFNSFFHALPYDWRGDRLTDARRLDLGTNIRMTTAADHTLSFVSLNFQLSDGSLVTPESLGVTVTFDSGINSPNVNAVPEPGSLTLCSIAGICAAIGGYRQRRARNKHFLELNRIFE